MDSRGRFIAEIKPLLKRLAGDAADYRAQSEVLEEQVRLLCEEVDAHEAAKEREARVDLGVDLARSLSNTLDALWPVVWNIVPRGRGASIAGAFPWLRGGQPRPD